MTVLATATPLVLAATGSSGGHSSPSGSTGGSSVHHSPAPAPHAPSGGAHHGLFDGFVNSMVHGAGFRIGSMVVSRLGFGTVVLIVIVVAVVYVLRRRRG